MRPRLALVPGPTPLVRPRALGEELGCEIWVKRDDTTGGADAGNKLRKLEFLLGDALDRGADTVVTCGGIQSNHARATAIQAAALGLRAVLLLRTLDPIEDGLPAPTGNLLLDRLVGAEVRLVTPAMYRERARHLAETADALRAAGRRPYVIPEGGSNGLGSLGYVEAMREVRAQLDAGAAGGRAFDVVVHACGSGGTAAGVALGAGAFGVAAEVWPMAVCDDQATFEPIVARILDEAKALDPSLGPAARVRIDDTAKGPAYAVMSRAQEDVLVHVARTAGLILDPVYTGKAWFGLAARASELAGRRVLFLHTGGLPGLLGQAPAFARLATT